MELYVGMDLHSNNTYVGILDKESDKKIFQKKMNNNLPEILYEIEPFRKDIKGIVVESTYNWYWLVDGLMDAGYKVHLANPAAMVQYKGMKYVDDKTDAFWLAHILSLGILMTGYIYPKEQRPVRDLLRKRAYLVRQRTSNILSLQSMITRHTSKKVKSDDLKRFGEEDVNAFFKDENSRLSAMSNLLMIRTLSAQIKTVETCILKQAKLRKEFECLLTVSGIGKILALSIMYEVGDISRFKEVGNFSSYCRCVSSKWTSNGKIKGKGNAKNGNKYLSWVFVEAAKAAKRSNKRLNSFYQKKESQRNGVVATKALANKLARASYYVMRDRVPFKEELLAA